VEKRDWLLLAIDDGMEPIQIQKTLFKFAMESGAPSNELYSFSPYNWGPCSFEIYDDLATMREENLVEFIPSGKGWNLYCLTDAGQAKKLVLKKEADSALLDRLYAARIYVTSRDFETLLKDIYKDYPKFALESLFNE
jgi:hypothetical protein